MRAGGRGGGGVVERGWRRLAVVCCASASAPAPRACATWQADFHKMPFEDNSFDHCYSIEACCHSPDRRAPVSTSRAAAQRPRPTRPPAPARERQSKHRAAGSLGPPRPSRTHLLAARPHRPAPPPPSPPRAPSRTQARCLPRDHARPQARGHLRLVRVVPGVQPTPARRPRRAPDAALPPSPIPYDVVGFIAFI